ncbi:DegT/DnrJ/EryC1/StrS family aminotransferase [Acidobacteria bacterium AH-259-A15]|nr:DegT/DnrJ/EryC1/StrS family aminotransferase [Acidobacteria bacterium AH-259-A15]
MIPVQRPSLGEEELNAIGKVFESRWLGMGSTVKEFEEELKRFLGVKHVIAVNTGTSALHLALDAIGVGEGDEVIVPSLTYVASVQAILACGARPVFCDVQADTLNMDPADVARRATVRTRAIMPVHYAGLACEMDEILDIAREHNLRVVEDAAHAFGSTYKGRKVGTLGHVTCFSFDPIKNITCGEGGAVVTDDDGLAKQVVVKRILGIDKDTCSRYRKERSWFYEVVTLGYRYHMSNINAAIGLAQLKKFDAFLQRKREIVKRYDEAFLDVDGLKLVNHDLDEMSPFFYVTRVRADRRDDLMEHLKENGVGSGVHYIPNHLQPFFAKYRIELPVTEKVWQEIITLSLYYEISDEDVERVIQLVREFFNAA